MKDQGIRWTKMSYNHPGRRDQWLSYLLRSLPSAEATLRSVCVKSPTCFRTPFLCRSARCHSWRRDSRGVRKEAQRTKDDPQMKRRCFSEVGALL